MNISIPHLFFWHSDIGALALKEESSFGRIKWSSVKSRTRHLGAFEINIGLHVTYSLVEGWV